MSNAVTPQRGSRSSDMGDTPPGRQKHEKCLVSGSPSWEQCLDRSPGQRSRPRVLAPWRQQKACRVPFARLGSASAPASRLRSNQGRGPLAPGSYSRYRPSICHSFIDCTALHCIAKPRSTTTTGGGRGRGCCTPPSPSLAGVGVTGLKATWVPGQWQPQHSAAQRSTAPYCTAPIKATPRHGQVPLRHL